MFIPGVWTFRIAVPAQAAGGWKLLPDLLSKWNAWKSRWGQRWDPCPSFPTSSGGASPALVAVQGWSEPVFYSWAVVFSFPSQNCSPPCPGSPGAFPLVTGLNFRPPGDPVTQALFFYLLHFPPQGWGLMVTKDTRCPSVVATRWQNALCAWKGRVEPPENRDGLSLQLPSAASINVIFL